VDGLRKRQRAGYVRLWNDAVDDSRLSLRALGLLAVILRKPPGWQFRAEQLAAESDAREGRDAIQTAMRELCAAGYYRVERRQHPSGRFTMGTAVSDMPDPEWARQYAEAGGKPVTVVQQADGTWAVRRPDGSLVPDGFTETGIPGPGAEAESAPPKPENPGPGNPAPGNPVSLSVQVTHDGQSADSLRSSGEQHPLDGMPDRTESSVNEVRRSAGRRAQTLVRRWFDWRDEQGIERSPQGFGVCLGIVRDAILAAGWGPERDEEVLTALTAITTSGRALSTGTLDVAMRASATVTVLRQRPVTDEQRRQHEARASAF
jgi:hypothetical protein